MRNWIYETRYADLFTGFVVLGAAVASGGD